MIFTSCQPAVPASTEAVLFSKQRESVTHSVFQALQQLQFLRDYWMFLQHHIHCIVVCLMTQTDVTTESVAHGDVYDDEHSKGLMLLLMCILYWSQFLLCNNVQSMVMLRQLCLSFLLLCSFLFCVETAVHIG